MTSVAQGSPEVIKRVVLSVHDYSSRDLGRKLSKNAPAVLSLSQKIIHYNFFFVQTQFYTDCRIF